MQKMKFTFGKEGMIRAGDSYTPGGFGFVTERERLAWEELRIFEVNSGFDVPYWYRREELTHVQETEEGCYVDSCKLTEALWERDGLRQPGERRVPLCFKASVPAVGNYRVSITVKALVDEEEAMVFMGRRHLMWKGSVKAGQRFRRTFTVNICDVIPNETKRVFEDRTLDVALVGNCMALQELTVEEADCPTVYLAGDSTMTDDRAEYPYHPFACYSGWGQAFDAWLDGGAAVCNQAHCGRTTESFRAEGHLGIVMKYIRPGDYFLIQFGHNDQKLPHLQAMGGYLGNLRRFVEEIRDRDAYPVILTPIARNTWREEKDGLVYNDLLWENAQACGIIGREAGVPVLDLHGASMADIVALGRDASKVYYHEDDWTHTNDYGAYRAAGYVASELRRIKDSFPAYRTLADAVGEGLGNWEPQTVPLLTKPGRLAHIQEPVKCEDGEAARNHQAEIKGALFV